MTKRLRAWFGPARPHLQLDRRRSVVAAVLLLGASVALIGACDRVKTLDFLITVPPTLEQSTRWIEISVYDNVQCSLAGRVAYGEAPVAGPIRRVLFSPGDDTSKIPALGDLPSGYYAFVAQVKDADCRVIARGCDGLDIGSADTVRIATRPDTQDGPPCGQGLTCQLAQCLPQRSGQNCSLDVIGSGPLSVYIDPETPANRETEGLAVAAPAVRAISSTFLATYGQFNVDDGDRTTVVAQPIARNGGLFRFVPNSFLGRCTNQPQEDGTGLAWSTRDNTGLSVVSQTQCDAAGEPTNTALQFFGFDKDIAALGDGTISISRMNVPGPLTLGQNHAVASLGGGRWVVAPVIAGQAEAVFIAENGAPPRGGFEVLNEGVGQVRVPFGIPASEFVTWSQTTAAIDVSTSSVVMVAINEGAMVGEPVTDAGTGDAGPTFRQGEVPDAERSLSVQFLPLDRVRPGATLPTPYVIPSRFASVAIVDNRAFVVGDGAGPSDPDLYAINFDPAANPAQPPTAERYAVLTNGEAQSSAVDYADVAVAFDRVFVATAIPGDIILTLFGTAATNPSALQSIRLSQVRASTVGSIRDGRVSVAVEGNRVIVVWTTAKQLKANDPMGGYVIFACEPPT